MRGAVTGSAAVHLGAVGVLVILQARAPMLMVGPDAIQVALLENPTLGVPAAAPPVRTEVKTPDLDREEGTGVKVTPAKPRPKPREAPAPERPADPTVPTLSSAPLGRGLSGDVAVDAANFEFGYYLLLLRNRVAANWTPPSGGAGGGQPIRAVVFFRVGRDGTLQDVRLESPSPADFFDRSALRAVAISDPMPPLPEGFTGASLGVHFGFDYTAP